MSQVEVGAGLVAYSANGTARAARITSSQGSEYESAYTVELLALTAVTMACNEINVLQCRINSDYQSAIHTCVSASRGRRRRLHEQETVY